VQSGVLSSENLADVLRGISQRRRQGILEVTCSDSVTSILFVQGRVVEAMTSKLTSVQETVEWLERAGYPVADPKEFLEETYSALQSRLTLELSGEFALSEEQLQHVIRQRVLDRLYKLDVGAGSFYTFKEQMVEHDKDFAPSISIGQLLLDLVELSAERDDFDRRFPDNSVIRRTEGALNGASPEETIILRMLGAGIGLSELERRCLLSSYHFRHSLLDLLNNGGISVVPEKVKPAQPNSDLALDSFLSDSIDLAFGSSPEGAEAIDHDEQGTLEQLVETDDYELLTETEQISQSGTARVYLLSARLLQNSMVPRVVAIAFVLLALFAPLLAWREVISLFADM
jgi:hypothetical protein